MTFSTTTEISKQWNISPRRIALLCEEGRVKGSTKKGKTWLIPSDATKPKDERYKSKTSYNESFETLEKKYKTILPESTHATYSSLLNYSDELNKPFQRWFRYKEGFSVDLVEHLIKEHSKNKSGIILDPFAGSGSTLLAANNLGYSTIGFEVNPFSYFLSNCKLDTYSIETIEQFKKTYEHILNTSEKTQLEYKLPKLSISNKVFLPEVEKYFMSIGVSIEEYKKNKRVHNLLKLGWLACLEPLSNYKKAGNGLKIKKYASPKKLTSNDVKIALLEEYQNIYIDLLKRKQSPKTTLYNDSCLNMARYIKECSIDGIIFSPPYANCFDYTEIYKLELWFGKFVTEYSDLKILRNNSLHSHLNINLTKDVTSKSNLLSTLLKELEKKDLWDKKIPKMLKLYYDDMFRVLDECYRVLKSNGFCCIVIGNSAYGGIIFPADLILSEYAQRIGFTVNKIEVDRYIITSSQQYSITKQDGKYLRESIVCLRKNK